MFRKMLLGIPFTCIFIFVIWTIENYAYHGSQMQYYVLDLNTMFNNLNTNFSNTMFSSLQFLFSNIQKFNDFVNIDDTLTELKDMSSTDFTALTIVIYCYYILVLLGKSFLVMIGYIALIGVGINGVIYSCLEYVFLLFKFLISPTWIYMKPSANPYSYDPSSWIWSESSPLIPDSYWGSI